MAGPEEDVARGFVLALGLSRLFLSAAAAAAALAVSARRRAAGLSRRAAALWSAAAQKASPYFSLSDLAFLLCLVALWVALYAVCVWEDPAEFVSSAASVSLAALESVGAAFAFVPALFAAAPASTASSSRRTFSTPPSPQPSPFSHSSSDPTDLDSLARQVLSSPEFQSRVKELSAEYTRPLREELLAYSEGKAAEIRRALEEGERGRGDRMQEEVRQKLDEIRAHAEQRIAETIRDLEAGAESDRADRRRRLQEEIARLRESNSEAQQRLDKESLFAKQEVSRLDGEIGELGKKLEELNSLRADFEKRASSCCGKDAAAPIVATASFDEAALRSEAEAAVDRWALKVAAGDSSSDSKAVKALRNYLRSQYVTREDVEREVERLSASLSAKVRSEMLAWAEQSADATSTSTVEEILRNSTLVAMFREQIASDLTTLSSLGETSSSAAAANAASDQEILGAIQDALRVYDADKTGMFDFALESAGGTIASTRCTETHDVSNAVYSLFGIPFWWERNSPRTILQPGSSPGQCWAFKGSRGEVVVRLSSPIFPEVKQYTTTFPNSQFEICALCNFRRSAWSTSLGW